VGAYSPSRGTSNNGDVFDVPEEAHGNKREVEATVCFPETEADKCAQYLGALPWIDTSAPVEALLAGWTFSTGLSRTET
jgi:hypothetical protein